MYLSTSLHKQVLTQGQFLNWSLTGLDSSFLSLRSVAMPRLAGCKHFKCMHVWMHIYSYACVYIYECIYMYVWIYKMNGIKCQKKFCIKSIQCYNSKWV